MRILLVIDQFDDLNNGTTISAKRFSEGLMKLGHEVSVVATGSPAKNKYVLKEMPLPIVVSKIVREQGMTFAVPDKEILETAIREADVVHFYLPSFLSKKALKIAQELDVPHTAAFHLQPENITYTLGLGKSEKVNDMLYSYFKKGFYNQFGHIHCPSEFIANELKRHGYTSKLHVISNGIAEDFKYQSKTKPKEFSDKIVITMIGRLSNEKRQDLIFDAILKSKYSEKIQLILAGRGPNKKEYIKLGEKLTSKPIINFLNKEELIQTLSMTDIYVHSSDAEIEAISCIEAFACGLVPIIANSKKSATPQFALDDRSLFEAGNSGDLAKKIDYWIENPEERGKMEIKYAEHADKYSIDKSMKKIEGMFLDAIKDNNRG